MGNILSEEIPSESQQQRRARRDPKNIVKPKDEGEPSVVQGAEKLRVEQAKQELPHNNEAMKDADSIIDMSAGLQAGNQKKKKHSVEEDSNKGFMVYPEDLRITWGDDERYWKRLPPEETGDGPIAAVELWNVCWLEVRGKFDTKKLSPGIQYQVVFKVMIKAASYGWETPVTVGLKVPDGNNQKSDETKVSLMRRERGKFIDILVGEFVASQGKVGDVEFWLCETEAKTWKRGLVIRGVVIQPKN